MLKKSILPMSCGVLVMVMSGLLDAAEITLISHKTLESQLRDGMKLATGRIACREPHNGFYIWINASQNGKVGHYIVQNNREGGGVVIFFERRATGSIQARRRKTGYL